ncbi:MAG TPA: endonuclease NucS [Candidatus Nanoarchaeia archaeon]|nr:endonuclease NucS [Candidatus Nanoarchaeia archaeon]
MQDFVNWFRSWVNSGCLLVFAANCEVRYSGRAESYLPKGDRLVMIKPDNSVHVHQPSGNMPVNHMREGAQQVIEEVDGCWVVRSSHAVNKEELLIQLHKVYFFQEQLLDDGKKVVVAGTEADMAEMIYDHPEIIEAGFTPLSREEHTKYGFIDVFGFDGDNNLVVIECKRQTADLHAVTQLRRYVEKIKQSKGLDKVRGIIASPEISANAKKMLEDWGFGWRRIKPPKFLEKYDKSQQRLDYY